MALVILESRWNFVQRVNYLNNLGHQVKGKDQPYNCWSWPPLLINTKLDMVVSIWKFMIGQKVTKFIGVCPIPNHKEFGRIIVTSYGLRFSSQLQIIMNRIHFAFITFIYNGIWFVLVLDQCYSALIIQLYLWPFSYLYKKSIGFLSSSCKQQFFLESIWDQAICN